MNLEKRKGSPFHWVYWRDALGKPHHASTKVRIVPEGVSDVAKRNRLKGLNKQKALDLGKKWEADEKGEAIPTQDAKVTAEIANRKLPGDHNNIPSRKDYLVNFLLNQIDGEMEGTTAKLKLGYLEAFFAFQGPRADLLITTLLQDAMKAFSQHEKGRGQSESAVAGALGFFHEALGAVVGKYFRENPAAGLVKRPTHTHRRPLEKEEMRKLLGAALGYVNGRQWVTIILFGLYLGLRISDAIRMRWSIINLDEGYVDFTQFKLRRKKKEMRVPFHDDLLRWLLHIRKDAPDCDEIVPDLMDRAGTSLSDSFNRIVVKAEIKFEAVKLVSGVCLKKVVFQCLRHTIVTWLDDLGVPESHRMELVGQARVATNHVYSHTRLKGLRRTVAKLPSVAPGVVPLAELSKSLPTSTGLLSDELQQEFATMEELLVSGSAGRRMLKVQLNKIKLGTIAVVRQYESTRV